MTHGLPDDWRPPERRLLERAWDEHPEVDELNRLKAERDERGWPTWELQREEDGEGDDVWISLWLRPVDPRDDRGIRVVRYPIAWAQQANRDAEAIADEWGED